MLCTIQHFTCIKQFNHRNPKNQRLFLFLLYKKERNNRIKQLSKDLVSGGGAEISTSSSLIQRRCSMSKSLCFVDSLGSKYFFSIYHSSGIIFAKQWHLKMFIEVSGMVYSILTCYSIYFRDNIVENVFCYMVQCPLH